MNKPKMALSGLMLAGIGMALAGATANVPSTGQGELAGRSNSSTTGRGAQHMNTITTEDGTQIYVLDPAASAADYWSFQKIEQAFELRANRELHMIQY